MLSLRNANPEGFENFLNQLNDYTMDALKALSEATSDQILVQQGRCQQLRSLMRLFVECDKTDQPTPQ
jgi:hypothetical protein